MQLPVKRRKSFVTTCISVFVAVRHAGTRLRSSQLTNDPFVPTLPLILISGRTGFKNASDLVWHKLPKKTVCLLLLGMMCEMVKRLLRTFNPKSSGPMQPRSEEHTSELQ